MTNAPARANGPESIEKDGLPIVPRTRTLPTREAWLAALADELRPMFGRHKAAIPPRIRFSCGWPSRRIRKVIGECWAPTAAADGVTQVFVSPALHDPIDVAAVLVHELVHAAVGPDAGHGAAFARVAKRLGLVGKMTATKAGPQLREVLADRVRWLGPYPHGALQLGAGREPKQGTRMVKLTCPDEDCGYTVRTTAKWIAVGLPRCPVDGCALEPPADQDPTNWLEWAAAHG